MLTTAPKVLYAKKHSITGPKMFLHLLPIGGYAIVPTGPVFKNIQSVVQKMTHHTKSPAVWQSVILKTNSSFFENTPSLAVDFPNPILQLLLLLFKLLWLNSHIEKVSVTEKPCEMLFGIAPERKPVGSKALPSQNHGRASRHCTACRESVHFLSNGCLFVSDNRLVDK